MQVRMLVLAGIAGACGWVARGIVVVPEATAQPQRPHIVVAAPPAIRVVMAPPDERAPVEVPEAGEVVEEETVEAGGEDLGAVIARAQEHVAEHNAIYGKVTDQRTGEDLGGVTVLVTGAQLASAQVGITDEQGFYKLTNLPTGYVLVTFYYGELTVQRDNVLITSLDPTPVYQRIDQSPPSPPPPPPPLPSIEDYAGNRPVGQAFEGELLDEEYIVNIPVPGRTFESVIGEASGEGDALGVTFDGGSFIENTYVIE
jgi:hypothetical protein